MMPRSARPFFVVALVVVALTVAAAPVCLAADLPGTAALTPPAPPLPTGPDIVATEDGSEGNFSIFEDGGYVVAWREVEGEKLYARLFGADDRPLGGPFEVGPVTLPPHKLFFGRWDWDLTALSGHRWAVAWTQRTCETCDSGVYLSLYDDSTPILERHLAASGDADREWPVLAAGSRGRFVLGWTSENIVPFPAADGSNFSDLFARMYDETGTPVSDVFEVNEDEFEGQILKGAVFVPSAEAGRNDVVFVWDSYETEGTFYDIVQRRFDDDGVALGGESRVNDNSELNQTDAAIGRTADGYRVVWNDFDPKYSGDPNAFDFAVISRGFAADGTPLESEETLLSPMSPPANRILPTVAGAEDGSFVVLWEARCSTSACGESFPDGPDGSLSGIAGRSFGTASSTGEIIVPAHVVGTQTGAVVHPDGPDSYLALWTSSPPDSESPSVVLRHIAPTDCTGLCLRDDRFQVTVEWKDFQGGSGVGHPQIRDDDWGTFWFFKASNVELAVKILDGTAINGHFWVFYSSLSNVEYTLRVEDRMTGLSATYENPSGRFGSRGDTTALPAVVPLPTPPEPQPAPLLVAPPAPLGTATAAASALTPASAPAVATGAQGFIAVPPCDEGVLCLNCLRFQVEIEWEDFTGHTGVGSGAPLTDDTGWFWFFRQGNPEVLVKVLDGRPVNGHFWVFYAALSNVGFTLRVTDRETDETMTYVNPIGTFASRGDTTAFADP